MELINVKEKDLKKLKLLDLITDEDELNSKLIIKIYKKFNVMKDNENFYRNRLSQLNCCLHICENCDLVQDEDNMKLCMECNGWICKKCEQNGKTFKDDFEIICKDCLHTEKINKHHNK